MKAGLFFYPPADRVGAGESNQFDSLVFDEGTGLGRRGRENRNGAFVLLDLHKRRQSPCVTRHPVSLLPVGNVLAQFDKVMQLLASQRVFCIHRPRLRRQNPIAIRV